MSMSTDLPLPDLRNNGVSRFENRLPDPTELLRWGGRPGVRYLMIDSRNLHEATTSGEAGDRWVLCRDVPIYTVSGPGGTTTMMVLSKGTPIAGADPANGIREWFYDRTLLTATGLASPYGGPSEAHQAPQAEDGPPGGQARRHQAPSPQGSQAQKG